jgi:hypothetical protein
VPREWNDEYFQTVTAKSYSTVFCVAAVAALAVLLSNPVFAARGDYCGKIPQPGFDQPPNQPRSARYVNAEYGYSVSIPPKLNGYVSPQGPERGFGIVLSWTPRAFLHVDAAYDAFFDITASGVHRSDLVAIRLHDTVVDDQASNVLLARKEGGRYLTRVRCGDDPQIFIHDQVIVIVNREIYRLDLQTVPARYDEDVKLLNAMLQSWRWEKVQARTP